MQLEMIHIRVEGPMLEIYSDNSDVIAWAKEKINQRVDGHSCQDDSVVRGWVRYNYPSKEAAIDAASNVTRQLLENKWEFQNYHEYVDGHWFKKLM